MADIFISYAREDRAHAEMVARGLSTLGLDVFWDSEIPPGRTWADFIQEKLLACKAVVVLWSATSTRSQWVREEARMGRDRGLLIPVMLDGTPAPFGFGEVQAADLSGWRGEAGHPGWERFAQAVQAAARRPAPSASRPTQPPAPMSPPPSTGAEALSPFDYVRKCLRLYFNANGRARRAEYWWWTVAVVCVSFVTGMIDGVAFGGESQPLSALVGLGLLAPGVCVTIRRFHDVGLSGWFVAGAYAAVFLGAAIAAEAAEFGVLIIIAVIIAILVVAVLPSRPGPNAYGPNPKGVPA
jgi:uncharacterized membrane protein YhaH (DUF805 family)